MNRCILLLSGALILALFSAGCIGGKDSARGPGAKDKKTVGEDGRDDPSLADAGYDSMTPENSMRRDLDLLRERERKQAQNLAAMRGELNENESLLKREENRLAETRTQIVRYEEALGQRPPTQAKTGFARQAEFAQADTGPGFSEYDHLFQRQVNANVARDAAPARQPQAEQTYGALAAAGAAPEQPFIRESNHFAGAPRGRARTDFSVPQQPQPQAEGEIVVWNPNDPAQAVPPEVMLGMQYVPPETQRQLPAVAAAPAAVTAHRRGESAVDESPYGRYTAETFSPDLYFGRGG